MKAMKKVLWSITVALLFLFPVMCQAACVQPPPDMVGWWSGDENADDLAGSNNGTLVNGATYATGMVGQAFSFDGQDDYINVPDDPSLRAITEFSIDFWANFDQIPRTGNLNDTLTICEKLNDYVLYWRADTERLELTFTAQNTGLYHIGANIPLGDIAGEWHHFAITSRNSIGFQTAEFHFYIDGIEQANNPNANPPSVLSGWFTGATGELNIGRRDFSDDLYFDGMIDELEIFDRVLEPAEVLGIYEAGSDGKCKTQESETIPTVNEWGMIIMSFILLGSAVWMIRRRRFS